MPRQKTLQDQEVLSIARKLFIDKGLSVSTRKIAAAAGISEAVLFQRFKSKRALIEAALTTETAGIEDLIVRAREHPDAAKALEDLAAALFSVFRRVAPATLPVLHRTADAGPRVQDLAGVFQSARRAVEQHLIAEVEANRLRVAAPAAAAALLVHALHHAALFEAVAGPSPDTSEGSARQMARCISGCS